MTVDQDDAHVRRKVEALASFGTRDADIARALGMELRTLQERFGEVIATAPVLANAKVAESLFRQATGEGRQAVTAAIFWLKARARWKEITAHEHSGPDGDPIQTLDLKQLSDDELNSLLRLVESHSPDPVEQTQE